MCANEAGAVAKPHISFVIYEGMTALDFLGPATVLTVLGLFDVDYVWRNREPVYGESGANKQLGFVPTATYADISKTDIICIAGTSNPYIQIMQEDMVEWVGAVGKSAEWVTSVCTGSFILGAAGLLKGYKATAHWTMVEELAWFGAEPVFERVVRDRNRLTGAGVTSGIDFGLTLLSILRGEEAARASQLIIEYDPDPPFAGGSPKSAPPELVQMMRQGAAAGIKENAPYAQKSLEDAARRLGVEITGLR